MHLEILIAFFKLAPMLRYLVQAINSTDQGFDWINFSIITFKRRKYQENEIH